MSPFISCRKWRPAVQPDISSSMLVRRSVAWRWRGVWLCATCLLKWERVVVWSLLTKRHSLILRDVKMLLPAKNGIRRLLIGRLWKVAMMLCLTKRFCLMLPISNRWWRMVPIRVWEWELPNISRLSRVWTMWRKLLLWNRWSIWGSNRVNPCWARRSTMCS